MAQMGNAGGSDLGAGSSGTADGDDDSDDDSPPPLEEA
jgi:hypothetical protein